MQHRVYQRPVNNVNDLKQRLVETWSKMEQHGIDEAIDQCRRVLEVDSRFGRAQEELGRVYEQQEKFADAITAFEKAVEISKGDPVALASLGHAYASSRRPKQARAVLAELRQLQKTRYVSPYALAVLCVGLGQDEETFEHLDRAYEERSSALPFLNVNPRFDRLHGDPRFEALVSRMGLIA